MNFDCVGIMNLGYCPFGILYDYLVVWVINFNSSKIESLNEHFLFSQYFMIKRTFPSEC